MFGDDIDTQMMPLVSSINVAAGFHAGDPNVIERNVRLAKEYGVGVGVHPGFRDLVGFGRRHIDATPAELVNDCLYQLGAVREFVRLHGLDLQHFKLHGALYMHAARDEAFSSGLIEALQVVDPELPVLVMGGSVIDQVARGLGQPVVRESQRRPALRRHRSDRVHSQRGVSRPGPDRCQGAAGMSTRHGRDRRRRHGRRGLRVGLHPQ